MQNINNQEINKNQSLYQIQNNQMLNNIVTKDGKAYYLNIPNNNNGFNQVNPIIINNMYIEKEILNFINNNNQSKNVNMQQENVEKQLINNANIQNNINLNNKENLMNNQNIGLGNNNVINEERKSNTNVNANNIQAENNQSQQMNQNLPPKLKRKNKKAKIPRPNRVLKLIDPNDRRPVAQYKVERIRPVYAVPPSKKRSVSQGKPFNLINKYYDENYILEDDEEEASKNEEYSIIRTSKNLSVEGEDIKI